MRFQGFIGASYTLQSVNVDCQRSVNLYLEMDEAGTGEESEAASLVSTPGLKLLATLPTGPVRGVYTDSTGGLWAVGGNTLYQISSLFGYTATGTLTTSLGPVSFSDNGLQLVLVDGPSGYQVTLATGAYAHITDANFQGATQVDFIDGYFVFLKPNSEEFYLSPLNAVTPFNGLDVGIAEAAPDDLVGLVCLQENVYLFSQRHMEVWYDSGDNNFPFARTQGGTLEIGCTAAFTLAKIQNAICWLGQDKNGRSIVYRAQGLQPQRISTFALESVIEGLASDLSNARAWTYQQGGHSFYCLNLPGATTTWVFDSSTSLWHERAYLSSGSYQRHLADCHAFAYNTNVVGDYSSGKLYSLDQSVLTDNGNPIVRERTSPHAGQDLNRMVYGSFQLDVETGVGTDGLGQGTNPQVMLQWSNDWGHSWSNEHWTSLGPIGARRTRVIWRRLGSARDRVYRVKITDPVKVTLLGAEIDIQGGSS